MKDRGDVIAVVVVVVLLIGLVVLTLALDPFSQEPAREIFR